MIPFPKHKKLILFDGVCNLCNRSVQFVIKHDSKDIFMFTALQSEIGKEVIKHRAYGQKITAILGGKATHPVCGLPGGVSKGLNSVDLLIFICIYLIIKYLTCQHFWNKLSTFHFLSLYSQHLYFC